MSHTIKIRHPGKLHRRAGIDKDHKIPRKTLLKLKRDAKRDHDVSLEREATFALNARNWKHK